MKAFLPCKQVCRPRGREAPICPLPPHPQARPSQGCSPGAHQHPVWRGAGIHRCTQPVRESALQNQRGVSQGTSGPGKLPVTSSPCACPDAQGQARYSILQVGVCRHEQGLAGLGGLSHNHHTWDSREQLAE